MSKRLLPQGEEFQEFITDYKFASNDRLAEMSKSLGFANVNSLKKAMDNQGIYQELRKVLGPAVSLENVVLKLVQSRPVSVGEISREIDRSAETVIKIIDDLRGKGYEVVLDEVSRQVTIPQEPRREFKPTEFKYFKRFYRIGLVSDTHSGSKYQQFSLLYDAYKVFDERQVDFVLHAGDFVDGRDMYRGHKEEAFLYGADEQRDYVVKHYPELKRGRKTYIIGGQHDRSFWRDKGYNIIRAICQERKDLVDRGFFKAEFIVKGLQIGLQHPGGGVAYARSYRPQKIIEGIVGYVNTIPNSTLPILTVFGHWHIPMHLPFYMGVDAVSLPCFQAQTPFLEQRGLMPVVGFAIAEIQLDKNNNLTSTKIEFIVLNSQIKAKDY